MTPTPSKITLYDTTLRDGAQGEGIHFSLADKLRIAQRLDAFGMDYIEGGWPAPTRRTSISPRGAQAEIQAREARRLRQHPPRKHAGGEGSAGRPAARCRHARRHAGLQDLHAPRHRDPAHHAGGKPGHDPRHRRAPGEERPRSHLRRRAHLRRLQARPRIHDEMLPGGRRGRRIVSRPMRHERRHAAAADPGDHAQARRRGEAGKARHPHARRPAASASPARWPRSPPARGRSRAR